MQNRNNFVSIFQKTKACFACQIKHMMMMDAAEQMIDAAKQSEAKFSYLSNEMYEIDKFDDEDVDELLGWTNALNFDE